MRHPFTDVRAFLDIRADNDKIGESLTAKTIFQALDGANISWKIYYSETLPNGATISYKWARINLKMQESASPWCVLGLGNCAQQPALTTPAHAAHDQVCYNGKNEFVLANVNEPIAVPGRTYGVD